MIRIRLVDLEKDYDALAEWWKGHKWEAPPKLILPKLGAIVAVDGKDTAVAWLYMDNSVGVCMFEYLVTNPQAKALDSIRAISQLVGFLRERALELNYGVMLTTCRQASLARVYERNGFVKTDEGVTHLLMLLRTAEG